MLPKTIRAGCSALLFAVLSPLQAQTYTSRLLHSFNGKQGENPFGSGLVRDSAGNLYGTTKVGGAANAGVVFKLSKSGKEAVLYTFKGGADGSNPNGGPILDSAGNLYGTPTRALAQAACCPGLVWTYSRTLLAARATFRPGPRRLSASALSLYFGS